MADIKSINGNPIVVGTSGIEESAVTQSRIADTAVHAEKIVDGAITPSKIASGYNLATVEAIAGTNLLARGDVSQGSLSSVTDADATIITSAIRIAAKLTFDTATDITIVSEDVGYGYCFAAFDANGGIISSRTTYLSNHQDVVGGVRKLNIIIKNAAGTAITPADFLQSGIHVVESGDFYSFTDLSRFSRLMFGHDKLPRDAYYWEQGGYANRTLTKTSSAKRIRTYMVPFFSKTFMVRFTASTHKIIGYFYDDNGEYIGNIQGGKGNTDNKFVTEDTLVSLGDYGNVAYASFTVARVDETNIAPSDIVGVPIVIEDVADGGSGGPVLRLKVMTYNMGRFSYGMEPKYLSVDYNEKLANYKRFFSEQRCDIVGAQECNVYLDGATAGSETVDGNIFDYLMPYHRNVDNWTCIKSQHPLYGGGVGTLTTGRKYVETTANINGREIYLLCVHFTPNAGEEQEALRAREAQEVINLVSGHEYFIVFGDFNAQSTVFYDTFLSSGFKIANGGYLPFEWTCSLNPQDWTSDTPSASIRYYDNILVSGNIIVNHSERMNVYTELASDHVPFVAYLTVN